MSGTGKSSALAALAACGWKTIDTDSGPWQIPDDDGDLIWDEPRIARLLDETSGPLALAGTVRNQGRFRDRFDAVVLLTAPLEVMLHRVATRTTNPYGHTQEDQNAIRTNTAEIEPLLRASADLVLDTSTLDPTAVVDRIEAFLRIQP